MIGDVLAIVRKEILELFSGGGRGKFAPVVLLAIYGIVFPLRAGSSWVNSYEVVGFAASISVFLSLSIVADAFAGERERHTLETLLASRLSDLAILIGKVATVVLYGWGLTLASLIVGLVAVNVVAGSGHIMLYPGWRILATVVLSLLLTILSTGIGVLVSLRATTVRQATQILTIGPLALFFVIFFGLQALPASIRSEIVNRLNSMGLSTVAIMLLVALLAVDSLVLYIDSARFQRARLILD